MDRLFLELMLAFGVLLIISVMASKTTSKFGIPILLIFIAVGMLAGSEGPGGMYFDDPELTQVLGTVSLLFILFSGGLATRFNMVVPIWREGVVLASSGVLVSMALMAFLIHWCMNWSWSVSALLGAAISSTDAAAVFATLKTRRLNLKPNLQAILELESGSNDPMAVFLTISLIQLVLYPENLSWSGILTSFFIQMSLGALAGWIFGKGLVKLINWLDLEFVGLYPVLTIAGVMCIYSLTEYCGGNGFLSVYLAGVTMGSEKYFSKKTLGVFHDGIAWLMQVAMFLALGLLVFPSQITPILGPGLLLSLGLIFVARPVSTFISLFWFKYSWREMLFISWGGLRGAVPIILATYSLVAKVPEANTMFNLVFFIVIITMVIQGSSLGFMAKWMGAQVTHLPQRVLPFKSRNLTRDFVEYEIHPTSPLIGRCIFQLKLPKDVLVVLIHRRDQDFIPRGNSEIEVFDRLICLTNKNVIPELDQILKPT